MNFMKCYFVLWTLVCLVQTSKSDYHCGIRKHSFVELVYRGWKVEEGQWPWHVGLFQKVQNKTAYACGGTLVDRKYVLTAAHCVVIRQTKRPLPTEDILLHFGRNDLKTWGRNVQVRDVGRIYVHPEYTKHLNDIAVLELRLPVEFTDFIIPICLDMRVDSDLHKWEGQRGWMTGWGLTENGTVSSVLRSASLPVVSYLQCVQNDPTLFGKIVNPNVFCAGDRNGTSAGTGDSGGGLYFSEGDRWVLKGIVSFAKIDESRLRVDTSKYTVFVNVQRFLTWIREVMGERFSNKNAVKRISEKECDRLKSLTRKRTDGSCIHDRYPHTVSLEIPDGEHKCNGILVNENHVLTTCYCNYDVFDIIPTMVRIGESSTVNILSFICHPAYKQPYNDIAIVRLDSPIQLSSNIIPACLASNWTENLYDTLLTTGFGKTFNTIFGIDGVTKFFESDTNQVITTGECNRNFTLPSGNDGIVPAQLCVINNDKLPTPSNGFIGAPLQTANTRTCLFTAIGVLSETAFSPMARSKTTIYSRVANYLDWIEETVWGKEAVPETTTSASNRPIVSKRISEKECDRFKNFVRKHTDGSCLNAKYPHMVSLVFPDGSEECNGILVNEQHVLTACNCGGVGEYTPSAVRIGTYGAVNISNFTCHPAYKWPHNDIAIVRLESPVQLSFNLIPACLTNSRTENLYGTLQTTGYKISIDTRATKFFESTSNRIITTDECNRDSRIVKQKISIVPAQLCVINNDSHLPTGIWGTSGAPLQTVNPQTCMFSTIGVLGYGYDSAGYDERTANDTILDVFFRVAHYLDWIEQTVWGVETVLETTTSALKPTTTQTLPSTVKPSLVRRVGQGGLINKGIIVFPDD